VLKATVREIAPEETTAFAEVRLSLGRQDLRARLTRAAVDELRLEPGAEVFALIKSVALDRRLLLPSHPEDEAATE
jgi:molybdate transport system ATP-binding protein